MTDSDQRWYDEAAGPLVRLYAVTTGRAHVGSEQRLDLMTVIHALPDAGHDPVLSPEQAAILHLCRPRPHPVADIASDSGLPLAVVRVLLSDLLAMGLIRATPPVPPARLPDARILRKVIDGLRAL
ncbi:conserved hypothetical protein [Streptomyces himastatinicus ATCC 53653]|uniref:DUF742 domain-containing protein n=1 Tax=Streptomyces himastatinicus ATCC 53653 TaxID=457427 RepID=D9WKR3_9ACTN|nr:DUF742 domain-containing protein [Streptomyces himastatinicus]EFL27753.1 conserved hypothetical protein [Streptomyces himastatinicus ATCC 53653]